MISNGPSIDHLPGILDFTPEEIRTSPTKVMVTLSSSIDSVFDNKKSKSSWMLAIVFVVSDSDGCNHFEQTVIAPATRLAPRSFKGVFDCALKPSYNQKTIYSEETTTFRIALAAINVQKSTIIDSPYIVGNFLEKIFNNRSENDSDCFESVQLLSKLSTDFFTFKDGQPSQKTLPIPLRKNIFSEKSFQSKQKRIFKSRLGHRQFNIANAAGDEKVHKYDRKCKIRIVEILTGIVFATKDVSWGTLFREDSCSSISDDDIINGDDPFTRTYNDERQREKESTLLDTEFQYMDNDTLDSTLDMLVIEVVEALVTTSKICGVQEVINTPDSYGFTLVHYVSLCNFQALMPVLLAHGAIPDLPTVNELLTPLHLACSEGNRAVVDLLVRNGCSITACDSNGKTPLDHALCNGHIDIFKEFQKIAKHPGTEVKPACLSRASIEHDL